MTRTPPFHVRETRFAALGFVKVTDTLWRIVARDSDDAVIGPQYHSRSELLQDLEHFAREFGADGASVATVAKADPVPCTFRIVRFNPSGRYIGIAWNYDKPVMVTTRDCDTYALARRALELDAADAGAELRWFDGEYVRNPGSDFLVSI